MPRFGGESEGIDTNSKKKAPPRAYLYKIVYSITSIECGCDVNMAVRGPPVILTPHLLTPKQVSEVAHICFICSSTVKISHECPPI